MDGKKQMAECPEGKECPKFKHLRHMYQDLEVENTQLLEDRDEVCLNCPCKDKEGIAALLGKDAHENDVVLVGFGAHGLELAFEQGVGAFDLAFAAFVA